MLDSKEEKQDNASQSTISALFYPILNGVLTEEEINKLPSIKIPKNLLKATTLKQFYLIQKNDRRRKITVKSRGLTFHITLLCMHYNKCLYLS